MNKWCLDLCYLHKNYLGNTVVAMTILNGGIAVIQHEGHPRSNHGVVSEFSCSISSSRKFAIFLGAVYHAI